MTTFLRRAQRAVAGVAGAFTRVAAPWPHPESSDPLLDHGHIPYAAWEAELTAYARLRTGAPVKVTFALAHATLWSDEIHLGRPAPAQPVDEAFQRAELALEHALMHHRHGWREAALLWHTWSHAGEQMLLPWPPWDQVSLSPAIVREALARAIPDLALPAGHDVVSERRRTAARWIAAAWADGAHRALDVAERPGLESRLPAPGSPSKPILWHATLVALAGGPPLDATAAAPLRAAVDALLATTAGDLRGQVERTLALVDALAQQRALPPSPELRPSWLTPTWGRWRLHRQVLGALDAMVRTPETQALSTLATTARATRQRSLMGPGGGVAGPGARGQQSPDAGGAAAAERRMLRPDQPADAELEPPSDWGLRPESQLPSDAPNVAGTPGQPTAEGSGSDGGSGPGSGPGALGALHVITPSAEDRAAYWQLRGALAPQIEQLIERLRASSDAYYASVPHRFQRRGRIDRPRLAAALKGREAVFTQHVHRPEPEHALCLVLDCSASMQPHAEHLREIAILVESAATAVGASVTAFTFGPEWDRLEPPAKGAPLVSLGRELHPRGGTPFGQAISAAAAWLAHQPYEEKRLWVVSDGRWSARDRAVAGWRADHLKNVVVWVLDETVPEPPHPAMRLAAAPTLTDLIQQAPHHFWLSGQGATGSLATTASKPSA